MKARAPNGFTLVETLLTVAVLAVGLTAVTGMVAAASSASRAARELRRMDAFAAAVFTEVAILETESPDLLPGNGIFLPTPDGPREIFPDGEEHMFPGEDLWELAPQLWYRLETEEISETQITAELWLSSRGRGTERTYRREIFRQRRAW